MKKIKRERSVRILEGDDSLQFRARPSPADFVQFFPWACAELGCPATPTVRRQLREEYVTGKASDKGKSSRGKKGRAAGAGGGGGGGGSEEKAEESASAEAAAAASGGERGASVAVAAVYEQGERLVEVAFVGGAPLPRVMLQVLALCLPLEPQLATLRVRGGRLDVYSLHEVKKFLPQSALTDVCLDDSPLPQNNYYLLLDVRSRLRRLSLSRCRVGDAGVAPLALRLRHPPACALRVLELVSNRISDAGAADLAAALRTNRTLRHLNLAGNRITDVGCFALLDALAAFPLDCDEILAARRRRLVRARERLAAEEERRAEEAAAAAAAAAATAGRAAAAAADDGKRKAVAKGKSASSLKKSLRAEGVAPAPEGGGGSGGGGAGDDEAAAEEREERDAPYGYVETECRDGYVYCVGNAALVSLNLAYNEVEYPSVRRALAALQQRRCGAEEAAAGRGGLMRLVVEGNHLPTPLPVLEAALEAALERNAGGAGGGGGGSALAASAKRKAKSAK